MGSDLRRRLLLWSVVIVVGSFLAVIVMRVPIPDVLHYLLFGSMLLLFAFLMKELLFGKKE
jgi:hypothetical protein